MANAEHLAGNFAQPDAERHAIGAGRGARCSVALKPAGVRMALTVSE
jgi:hypothetical protein